MRMLILSLKVMQSLVLTGTRKRQKNSTGRGLCMSVKKKVSHQLLCVRERVSTRSYEILTVSFRPHYLPREFSQVTVIPVYIPGPDIDTQAAERVAESYRGAVNRPVNQTVFLLGDLNACDITGLLPNLHQHVTCPTRSNKTLLTSVLAIFLTHFSHCVGRLWVSLVIT